MVEHVYSQLPTHEVTHADVALAFMAVAVSIIVASQIHVKMVEHVNFHLLTHEDTYAGVGPAIVGIYAN